MMLNNGNLEVIHGGKGQGSMDRSAGSGSLEEKMELSTEAEGGDHSRLGIPAIIVVVVFVHAAI